MEIAARRARAADLEELAALADQARAELVAERSGPLHLDNELGSDGSVSLPAAEEEARRLVAVATIDEVVVGYLDASLVSTAGTGRTCLVRALYVEPGAREVGAGEALLDLASSWGSEAGALGLDAFALPGAREVKNFFEGHGFAARLIVMHRSLR